MCAKQRKDREAHHFERVGLYEHGLSQRAVGWVRYVDSLPRQGLQYVPMVQAVVVLVRVHVGQRQAVKLGVGKPPAYRRFQVLLIL